jgi:TonB family protein
MIHSTRLLRILVLGSLGLPGAFALATEPDFVPMKMIQSVNPLYPPDALRLGITTGEARVSIQIDPAGRLSDHLVTAYTHPAFAESAVAALKQWQFEPARLRGQPVSVTEDLVFSFRSGAIVVEVNVLSIGDFLNARFVPNANSFRACPPGELDRIPTPIKVVKPDYAPEQARQGAAHVVVSFYIDPEGHVRLPAVSYATNHSNEELSAAAVTALEQWQFDPPRSGQRPALVQAQQDFYFRAAAP